MLQTKRYAVELDTGFLPELAYKDYMLVFVPDHTMGG